ncbi:MAG: hypothetical protein GF317_18940, partial [Candidatus Lokiarchaeota archaeon]|nr:hypothetical protein [Candidatus Lokiarchaeota archaeon]
MRYKDFYENYFTFKPLVSISILLDLAENKEGFKKELEEYLEKFPLKEITEKILKRLQGYYVIPPKKLTNILSVLFEIDDDPKYLQEMYKSEDVFGLVNPSMDIQRICYEIFSDKNLSRDNEAPDKDNRLTIFESSITHTNGLYASSYLIRHISLEIKRNPQQSIYSDWLLPHKEKLKDLKKNCLDKFNEKKSEIIKLPAGKFRITISCWHLWQEELNQPANWENYKKEITATDQDFLK